MATPGEKQEMEEVLDMPASSATTLPVAGKQEYSEPDRKVATPIKDDDQSSVAPSDVASSSAAPDVVVYHKPPPKQFVLIMIAYVFIILISFFSQVSFWRHIAICHTRTISSYPMLHSNSILWLSFVYLFLLLC